MAWITPKTDWDVDTVFSYTDYNRIRNNLLYLNDKINTDYPDKAKELDLGDAKTGYDNNYRPSEFNAFEDALESFTRIGQNVNIGTRSYYSANGDFISFSDLNRIENCCLKWYTTLNVTVQSINITPSSITVSETGDYVFTVSMFPQSAESENYTYSLNGATSAITASKNGMNITLSISELELQNITLTVSYKGKTGTANIKIGAGTWFIFKNNFYYYDFMYLGSDLDATGVSTVLGRKMFDNYMANMDETKREFVGTFGINGTWSDDSLGENSEYMTDIQNFVNKHFSTNLQNNLQSVTKWMMKGFSERYQYTSKFFLPSKDEVVSWSPSHYNFVDLKTTTYDYIYNNVHWCNEILGNEEKVVVLTRSIVHHRTYGGDYRYSPVTIETYPNRMNGNLNANGWKVRLELRPLFFLSNSLKVKPCSEEGIDYQIDWTGQSSTTLSSIPVGSIVADLG